MKEGIQAGAMPLGRLQKALQDLTQKNTHDNPASLPDGSNFKTHSNNKENTNLTSNQLKRIAEEHFYHKPGEQHAYDERLLIDKKTGEVLCFEEARARHYHAALKQRHKNDLNVRVGASSVLPVLKPALRMPPSSMIFHPVVIDEGDEEGDDFAENNLPACQAVNPDDLTGIGVWKDNTADVRALISQAKSSKQVVNTMPKSATKNDFCSLQVRGERADWPQMIAVKDGLPGPLRQLTSSISNCSGLLGRDGSGPNRTVSSIKLADNRQYFLEKCLPNANNGIVDVVAAPLASMITSNSEEEPRGKVVLRVTKTAIGLLEHELDVVQKLPLALAASPQSIIRYTSKIWTNIDRSCPSFVLCPKI